jgi:hypothetical protein
VAQRFTQPLRIVEIPRWLVAATHNHPGPVAHARVARRAIHVEPLLPTGQHLHGYRKRHHVGFLAVRQSRVEVFRFVQLPARHRVLHLRPR